ncbi:hypothetical protein N0V93_009243 [Gnomoniopsis smithogilvyi]|uniref:Pyridoxamine 5'-phosphate oxidase N-terminal domain-containing protein n=1 Tax=Gnomoniopsis smithogilvyi TaxID=1191159 RepID=A0A9W8YKH2_9PEZI|nr:hypothetical protein N0V93_009243 [Gnomoniopsis smithogilvyi]
MSQIPLNAAASNGDIDREVTTSLPPEVVQCLENARFLHLATCTNNIPTVSLMNYTYLPPSTSPYTTSPLIIMTTNPASKKMSNLLTNPHVSLLVHDWVSHRPPTHSRRLSNPGASASVSPQRSSLASLLLNINTSAMSSISATINGPARLIEPGSDEERWYRRAHLENNTFDDGGDGGGGFNPFGQIASGAGEDGGRECFVAGEEVRVIVVDVKDVRISDWKGNVKDWVLVGPEEGAASRGEAVLNGVS